MNDPVDLVYLWCDAADEKWRAKMQAAAERENVALAGDNDASCRFVAHDELRYSLRSVEMFAPWVRRIFIVVDDIATLPSWLVADNPRIGIVRHSRILPDGILPCFNSTAIEHHLWKIDGLAERFLYANDDMFFAAPCSEGFFFAADGYPIVRRAGKYRKGENQPGSAMYRAKISNAQEAVAVRFGMAGEFAKAWRRLPHHNIDAYRRSDFRECYHLFESELTRTSQHAFRSPEEIQRSLYSDYALAVGHAHFRLARWRTQPGRAWYKRLLRPGYADSLQFVGPSIHEVEQSISHWHPKLICINESRSYTEQDHLLIAGLYEKLYPHSSAFEVRSNVNGKENSQ